LRELALEQKPKHGNRQGVDCEVPDGLAEVGGVFPACDGEGKPGKDDYQPDKRPNAQPSKRVELEKPKRFLRLRFSVFVNEKCQSSVSRCMENSHQLRENSVCRIWETRNTYRFAIEVFDRNPFTESAISSYWRVPLKTSMSPSFSTTENFNSKSFTAQRKSSLASSQFCSLQCAHARLYKAARDSSSLGAPKSVSADVKFATASSYFRISKHFKPLFTASAAVVFGPFGVADALIASGTFLTAARLDGGRALLDGDR
jgi:hypothetical protein